MYFLYSLGGVTFNKCWITLRVIYFIKQGGGNHKIAWVYIYPCHSPRDDYLDCGRCINVSTNWADSDYLSSDVPPNHAESADCLPECEQESIYLLLSSPTDVHHLLFKPANILYLFH